MDILKTTVNFNSLIDFPALETDPHGEPTMPSVQKRLLHLQEMLVSLTEDMRSSPDFAETLAVLGQPVTDEGGLGKGSVPDSDSVAGAEEPLPGSDLSELWHLFDNLEKKSLDELIALLSKVDQIIEKYGSVIGGALKEFVKGRMERACELLAKLIQEEFNSKSGSMTMDELEKWMEKIETVRKLFIDKGYAKFCHRQDLWESEKILCAQLNRAVQAEIDKVDYGSLDDVLKMLDRLVTKKDKFLNTLCHWGQEEAHFSDILANFVDRLLITLSKLDIDKKSPEEILAIMGHLTKAATLISIGSPDIINKINAHMEKLQINLQAKEANKDIEKANRAKSSDLLEQILTMIQRLQAHYNKLKDALPDLAKTLQENISSLTQRAQFLGSVNLYDVSTVDLEMAMMTVQITRAKLMEALLRDQLVGIQMRNKAINDLNLLMSTLRAAVADKKDGDKVDLSKIILPDGRNAKAVLEAYNISLSGVNFNDITKAQVMQLCEGPIKNAIDNQNSTQQLDMTRMQSLMNKRNECYDTLTGFIKKMNEQTSTIIRNMG